MGSAGTTRRGSRRCLAAGLRTLAKLRCDMASLSLGSIGESLRQNGKTVPDTEMEMEGFFRVTGCMLTPTLDRLPPPACSPFSLKPAGYAASGVLTRDGSDVNSNVGAVRMHERLQWHRKFD